MWSLDEMLQVKPVTLKFTELTIKLLAESEN